MNDNYIPFRDFQKLIGLKYASARKLAENAKIKTFISPSGQTLYNKQSVLDFIDANTNIPKEQTKTKYSFFYCRVSSKKQEEDLNRQVEYAKSICPNHIIIKDIASGINWKRKGLKTILEHAINKSIEEVVIFHKDRLCRFAFELIEQVIILGGGKIRTLEDQIIESSQKELESELTTILHVFSCKQMGKRRYKVKDEKNKTLSESGTESNTEELV